MPQHVQPSESASADRNPLTAEVYATLRSAISSSELQPRERLYEMVLARRFKMSRAPVRKPMGVEIPLVRTEENLISVLETFVVPLKGERC